MLCVLPGASVNEHGIDIEAFTNSETSFISWGEKDTVCLSSMNIHLVDCKIGFQVRLPGLDLNTGSTGCTVLNNFLHSSKFQFTYLFFFFLVRIK